MRIVIDTEIIKNKISDLTENAKSDISLNDSTKKIKRSIRSVKKEVLFYKILFEKTREEIEKHQSRKEKINSFSVEDYE